MTIERELLIPPNNHNHNHNHNNHRQPTPNAKQRNPSIPLHLSTNKPEPPQLHTNNVARSLPDPHEPGQRRRGLRRGRGRGPLADLRPRGRHDELHLRRLRLQVRAAPQRHHPLQGVRLPHPLQGAHEEVRFSFFFFFFFLFLARCESERRNGRTPGVSSFADAWEIGWCSSRRGELRILGVFCLGYLPAYLPTYARPTAVSITYV